MAIAIQGTALCDTPATWLPYTRHLATAKQFFAITGRQNDRTRDCCQIEAKSCLQTGFPRTFRHVSGLPLAQFKDCRTVLLKVLSKVWQDRPVGVVSIRAAIKRASEARDWRPPASTSRCPSV